MVRSMFPAVVGLLLVAGCGGTGAPVESNERFEQQADAALARVNRISALSPTSADRIPASGTSTFRGPAGISVTRGITSTEPDYLILGDATVNARFGDETMKGNIANLRGIAPLGGNRAVRADVSGTVTLGANGSSIGDNPATTPREAPNSWTSNFRADLEIDGQQVTSSGRIGGTFVGNRVGVPADRPQMRGIVGDGVGLATIGGGVGRMGIELAAEN